MWKRIWMIMAAGLLLAGVSAVQAEPPRHSGNAAMQYWQAFAQLPVMDDRQEKLLNDWKTVPLEGDAAKLLTGAQASLMYLHRAAGCPQCSWDLHYEDGAGLLMPHLAKCRTLALLACLQMRADFASGRTAEAVEMLGDVLRLSRHAASEPILISILVGYKIEEYAVDTAGPFLLTLAPVQLEKIARVVESLPAMATVKQTIITEKEHMCGWLLKKMEAVEKQEAGSWRTAWVNMLDPGQDAKDGLSLKLKSIQTYAQARQLVLDLSPRYDQLQQAMDLPYQEQSARMVSLLQEVREKNLLGELLLPALHKCQQAEHRQKARQRLFQAALLVAQKGKEQVPNDPYGSGPFGYKQLEAGFELTSQLQFQGQAVSYRVGK